MAVAMHRKSQATRRRRLREMVADLNPRPTQPASPLIERVAWLAVEHDIIVVHGAEFAADHEQRVVTTRLLLDDAAIASLTHEFGHCADLKERDQEWYQASDGRLWLFNFDGELFAWAWAIKALGRRWNLTHHQCFEECLWSYCRAFPHVITRPQFDTAYALRDYSSKRAGGVVFLREPDFMRV